MASSNKNQTKAIQKANKPRLTPQQTAYLQAYLDPTSPTFANSYRSAKSVGFAEEYSQNLITQQPKWLSQSINSILPSEIDIISKINRETDYGLKQGQRDTAMAAQTRLKALELLGKTKRTPVFENPRDNVTLNKIDHITISLGSQTPPEAPRQQIDAQTLDHTA